MSSAQIVVVSLLRAMQEEKHGLTKHNRRLSAREKIELTYILAGQIEMNALFC